MSWLSQPVNTCGGASAEAEKEVGDLGGEALSGNGGILQLPERSIACCPCVCLAPSGT